MNTDSAVIESPSQLIYKAVPHRLPQPFIYPMRIRIIAIGRCKPEFNMIVYNYLKRIRSPWHVEMVPIGTVARGVSGGNVEDIIIQEGEKLLAKLHDHERVILLDETGKTFGSREWSQHLQHLGSVSPDLALLIGGPDGHAPAVRARAAEKWSLSSLTFQYGVARVILAEQLYRAQSLLLGHHYHRDGLV
jgi:23S rRNA (pseudouridine1915-N3)-methyltransferase